MKHANMRLMCSPIRFAQMIDGLDDEHLKAICTQTGLGGLTKMKSVSLRCIMLVLLAKSYIDDMQSIHIAGKDISITPTDVYQLMDLPIEGKNIYMEMGKPKDANLLRAYQTDGRLKLSDLEDKIKASKTPDDHFIRRFVLYVIGIILAPTVQDYVDSKYFVLVEDVARIPNFNWGCFTLNHLITSINTFNYKDQVNQQGNLALLQVSATMLVVILLLFI